MNYKFRCKLSADYIGEIYADNVMIELSDQQVADIKRCIRSCGNKEPWQQIKQKEKKLYKYIVKACDAFILYAYALDCRKEELYNDVGYEEVDTAALLREDIEKNGFIPCDDDGLPYRNEELNRQWFYWEKDKLKDKTFEERAHYYFERYKFIMTSDLDDTILSFVLPSELLN